MSRLHVDRKVVFRMLTVSCVSDLVPANKLVAAVDCTVLTNLDVRMIDAPNHAPKLSDSENQQDELGTKNVEQQFLMRLSLIHI